MKSYKKDLKIEGTSFSCPRPYFSGTCVRFVECLSIGLSPNQRNQSLHDTEHSTTSDIPIRQPWQISLESTCIRWFLVQTLLSTRDNLVAQGHSRQHIHSAHTRSVLKRLDNLWGLGSSYVDRTKKIINHEPPDIMAIMKAIDISLCIWRWPPAIVPFYKIYPLRSSNAGTCESSRRQPNWATWHGQ